MLLPWHVVMQVQCAARNMQHFARERTRSQKKSKRCGAVVQLVVSRTLVNVQWTFA